MIKACENMPCCYKEYLTLGNTIGAVMTFKDYVYIKYGFWPQNVDEHSFKRRKESIEEPSRSTSLNKEEEEGTKGEDSSKPSACSRFMSLFGFSSNIASKCCDKSTNKDERRIEMK